MTLPNGITVNYGYDTDSRISSISYQTGLANIIGTLSYVYDGAGRRMQVGGTLSRTGLPPAMPSATYDVANQLTSWNGTSISYDANGNIANDGAAAYTWNGRNPFFVKMNSGGGNWVRASQLLVGDSVLTKSGAWKKITAISHIAEVATAYNFEVDLNHDYFAGSSGVLVHNGVCNPIPDRVARVISADIDPLTLGNPADVDVFVTDANAIQGMNSTELANALGIPESESGFQVIEFETPEGIASPINRLNPGFVGGGETGGGLPEFVVPNGPIPTGAVTYYVP